MNLKNSTFLHVCVFVLGLTTFTWGQATLTVPSASYPTIQSAITAASAGDTVLVGPGTYVENLIFPAKDFHLLGAGQGQTIIDGNFSGSCLNFSQPVSNAMVVEGMTLTNGVGDMIVYDSTTTMTAGGGVLIHQIFGAFAPLIEPTIKDCEITNNDAELGAGIFMRFAGQVKIEDCHIHQNPAPLGTGMTSGAIAAHFTNEMSMTGCLMENNTALTASGVINIDQSGMSLDNCVFSNNITNSASVLVTEPSTLFQTQSIKRCSFIGNKTLNNAASVLWLQANQRMVIENCLFAKNMGGVVILGFGSSADQTVRNCTFVDNMLDGDTVGVVFFQGGALRIENSIIVGNRATSGAVVRGRALTFTAGSYSEVFSIVETPVNSATLSMPTFIDAPNGDYHLTPGSTGVNAGTVQSLFPPIANLSAEVDREGAKRLAFTNIDLGCYEGQEIAYHSSSTSAVGLGVGGPYDILQVNGSTGSLFRTVTIPLGSSSTISMNQPPSSLSPRGFAIFGLVGEAQEQNITHVPLGIGEMTFAPCPLDPTSPSLFTLTNNIGGGCLPLTASTQTPWTSAPFPPIFVPLTLTFQGVLEETMGVYRRTNMVIFKVQ